MKIVIHIPPPKIVLWVFFTAWDAALGFLQRTLRPDAPMDMHRSLILRRLWVADRLRRYAPR